MNQLKKEERRRGMGKTGDILSYRSLYRKQISLGNQDNLTTINTLSEEKITFCCNTDHTQMTDFSFKFKHKRAVYIYSSSDLALEELRNGG